ncbi:MAG: 50S ribosomal protein L4 [Parcubacteria group bacterium]|nr:MAG: 50S ribosomal protein L4 [Parcubacteria group bacterium]
MAEIKVKVYDWQGQEAGTEVLDPALFGVKVNPVLIQSAVLAQQKNSRQPIAHTKGRGDVRGGGKKPWKQKGTGRARHGSIRSPLWIGGGITFGPTAERNFAVKINKKARRQALLMILSDRVIDGKLILLEAYKLAEPKTKLLKQTLDKLPSKGKSTLIVTKVNDTAIVKSATNLPKVKTIYFGSLNVVDLLGSQYIILNKEIIEKIKEQYLA